MTLFILLFLLYNTNLISLIIIIENHSHVVGLCQVIFSFFDDKLCQKKAVKQIIQ